MIAIFCKSAVDLRKNARDRARIAFVKNPIAWMRTSRRTAVRQKLQARRQLSEPIGRINRRRLTGGVAGGLAQFVAHDVP